MRINNPLKAQNKVRQTRHDIAEQRFNGNKTNAIKVYRNGNMALEKSAVKQSVPNFKRHLSSVFFLFQKLSFGKTFICKIERLNVKQRRSR